MRKWGQAQNYGNSRTLDQQLENLHGIELGPLYVGDNFIAFLWNPCQCNQDLSLKHELSF